MADNTALMAFLEDEVMKRAVLLTISRRNELLFDNSSRYYPPADSSREECTICIAEIETSVEITRLPCDHVFHGECISDWCVENNTCPICRERIVDVITITFGASYFTINCNNSNAEITVSPMH